MATINTVPLFLQTSKFSAVKSKVQFEGYSEIGCLQRVVELVAAIFYGCTLRPGIAWDYCQGFWTGYKLSLREFDPKENHQWKLLQKTNLQKQLILQSQDWENVLKECPETFEFAPLFIRKNSKFISLAVQRNGAMIQFVDKQVLDMPFLKQLVQGNRRVVLFLEQSLRNQVVESWEKEEKTYSIINPQTGVSPLELEQLAYVIGTCASVWQDFLQVQSTETRFLYLKRGEIGSPHTIQLFKDGKTWVHVHNWYIGKRTAKQVKLINDWKTGEQFAKLSILTKGDIISLGGEDRLRQEISFSEKLKGQRGIVQLIDTFAYPSKDKMLQGQKTVLIRERYTFSLDEEIPKEVVDQWTEEDVQRLTLDLLYGLKAFKDNNLYDGDFSFVNVLVQLDVQGHIVKAGFTDFEQMEVLTEKSRGEFFDPLDLDYEILTHVIDLLHSIYQQRGLNFPEVLEEVFYKKKGSRSGLSLFGLEYIPAIEELNQKQLNSEIYGTEVGKILNPYYKFEHMPTKTLEEIIAALVKNFAYQK